MKTLDTKINNLKIIKPKIYRDNRGYFFEIFNLKKYKKIISDNRFVQDDHSFSKKNVLRGIHFQHKKPQNQLLYLVEGKIFIVFVDLRPESTSFKKKHSLILDSKNHVQIFQPSGVGSGYYVLSKQSHLIYKVSELFDKKNEKGILWNDRTLNIKWPCKSPILSDNDKKNEKFENIKFYKFNELLKL